MNSPESGSGLVSLEIGNNGTVAGIDEDGHTNYYSILNLFLIHSLSVSPWKGK